jgi:hypothetical protein
MLSVGYLDAVQKSSGAIIRPWVVNAAFNGGNSGGPLLQIETGAVFGVVSSKLAPISTEAAQILQVLANQHARVIYNARTPDGNQVQLTEAQLVAKVLIELRNQEQLVIGKAVLLDDLTAFLRQNAVEP